MIETDNQLSLYLNHIKDETLLAIDTEFRRVDSYFPELCLIQIATNDKLECIDVLSLDNLEPLFVKLYDKITNVYEYKMKIGNRTKTMTREVVEQSLDSGLTESAINAILEIEAIGRLIIDLPSIIRGNDSSDLVVMNGDSLTIPKYDDVITVVGQVRRPGSFVRQESLTINDYIDLAAGLTQRADKSAIYIIKPNGSIQNTIALREKLLEFNSINGEVMAGDTIVIPIKSTYQTPLNYYSTVTQAIIQSLTSIFAIDALLGGN